MDSPRSTDDNENHSIWQIPCYQNTTNILGLKQTDAEETADNPTPEAHLPPQSDRRMVLSAKDLLKQLVRIPSVNPAFSSGDPGLGDESEITNFLQIFFQNLAYPWFRQRVHPGRDNLVVVCRAAGQAAQKPPILWDAHQDTVGVTGMQIDPFAAEEGQGRIWGRGACDVKGAMAAMLAALTRIQSEGAALQQTVILALTINEECGFSGIQSLCRLWGTEELSSVKTEDLRGPLTLPEIRTLRPARAIVAEPTLLDVVVAHKGSVRWRCHTHGKAAHTSRPEQGVNAISSMARVIQTIDQYQRDVLNSREPHPLCGKPTICVSTIQGGSGVNTIPDHAVIDIDRRLTPAEPPAQAYLDLVDYIDEFNEDSPARIEHEPPTNQSTALRDDFNRSWAEQVAAVASTSGHASQLIGVPYGTNAWALADLGIPTVVFGPGSIDQAHTEDEWIDITQLERATECFYRLAVGG